MEKRHPRQSRFDPGVAMEWISHVKQRPGAVQGLLKGRGLELIYRWGRIEGRGGDWGKERRAAAVGE